MDFLKYISTAHSTYSETSPLITRLKLTKGRIVGGWLRFPLGSAGKLHFKAFIGSHQVFPITPGESYSGHDVLYPLFGNIDLDEPPLTMDLHTWNESTDTDHALIFCVFIDVFTNPRDRKDFKRVLTSLEQGS